HCPSGTSTSRCRFPAARSPSPPPSARVAGEAPGFFADERGNIIVLFAVWLGLAASLGALAIDSASLYLERRELQATVDLAALAAVRDPARAGELARLALVDAGELASDAAGGELAADGIQRL